MHKVTPIHTVCDAMNCNTVFISIAAEVHKLLRLYFITSSKSERTFSVSLPIYDLLYDREKTEELYITACSYTRTSQIRLIMQWLLKNLSLLILNGYHILNNCNTYF